MQYSSIFHFSKRQRYRTGFGDRRSRMCQSRMIVCDSRRQRWSVARGRLSEDKQQPDIEGKLKRWLIYTMTVQFGEQFRFFFIRYRGSVFIRSPIKMTGYKPTAISDRSMEVSRLNTDFLLSCFFRVSINYNRRSRAITIFN